MTTISMDRGSLDSLYSSNRVTSPFFWYLRNLHSKTLKAAPWYGVRSFRFVRLSFVSGVVVGFAGMAVVS
jgi:hypothetical protein